MKRGTPRPFQVVAPRGRAELPGEVHTLVVDADVPEMITLFHVCGALVYFDDQMRPCGHDDVHTKIEMCQRHFEATGLGADFVSQFVR